MKASGKSPRSQKRVELLALALLGAMVAALAFPLLSLTDQKRPLKAGVNGVAVAKEARISEGPSSEGAISVAASVQGEAAGRADQVTAQADPAQSINP